LFFTSGGGDIALSYLTSPLFISGQDFIQPHDLESYKDATLSVPEQIVQLEKLHNALELFMVTKQSLHLNSQYLAANAR
jgi:hypothetical protein